MTASADQLREQIEHTQATLAQDVDALADRANPAHIARRKINRVTQAGRRFLDRIVGRADDLTGAVQRGGERAADVVEDLPRQAREQLQGSPLAAGAVAFGVGVLLAAAFPATRTETRLAGEVQDNADTLMEPVQQAARDVVDHLAEPAQRMAEDLRTTATEAAERVAGEADPTTARP